MNEQDLARNAVAQAVQAYCTTTASPNRFEPGRTPIPPSGKVIGEAETQAMVAAALDGWLTTGRFNTAFEKRLAELTGVGRTLTTNSGSSANLVAVSSLFSAHLGAAALTEGDEIITVAAGFPTTVNPIVQNGGTPVFVDILPGTYNIDAALLEGALSARTRAVVIAHTLGNPFDLAAVTAFCARHNLWLVEDCCDALGAQYTIPAGAAHWQPRTPTEGDPALWHCTPATGEPDKVGRFGHLATLSFYPAHHITMGEGGAVLADDPLLARIAESIRDWGRDCWCAPGCDNTCGKRFGWQLGQLPAGYDHKYTYSNLGYNLKITDMQAACGLAQLDRLDGFIDARRSNFAHLSALLAPFDDLIERPQSTPGAMPSWFGFPITLRAESGVNRVDMLQWLDQHKIGTRLLFAGNLTRQPYFTGRRHRVASPLVQTDRVMNDTFWIGVWPGLSEEMLAYMAQQIGLFLGDGL